MSTALAERDELEQAIRSLPDQQVRVVLEFVRDLEEEEHVPNAETLEAIREIREGRGQRFSSVEEMFTDMGFTDAYARAINEIQSGH